MGWASEVGLAELEKWSWHGCSSNDSCWGDDHQAGLDLGLEEKVVVTGSMPVKGSMSYRPRGEKPQVYWKNVQAWVAEMSVKVTPGKIMAGSGNEGVVFFEPWILWLDNGYHRAHAYMCACVHMF
jgi:hypothetical protein